MIEKIKAVVMGHAVGDALGVPVEFSSREELKQAPITDMKGFGMYNMPEGSWSDDTSMSLCALDAFRGNGVDFDEVLKNFALWYYMGEYTPTGKVFDVGFTCGVAIENCVEGQKHWKECGLRHEGTNGNGSLMRIHPFVLYSYRTSEDIFKKIELIEAASSITHAHPRSMMACGIYAFVLWELLDNPTKEGVRIGLKKAQSYYNGKAEASHFARLFDEGFASIKESDIKSGGYVVDSLEAAIWCLLTTESYKDCVLKAVNLGEDTDTVGAIAGSLAGAIYGLQGIPKDWLSKLKRREWIESLCEKACFCWENR